MTLRAGIWWARLLLLGAVRGHGQIGSEFFSGGVQLPPVIRWTSLLAAISQEPPPGQPNQAEQKPHTVRGTVVDSITGEPIYRALVQVGGESAALTDHEGKFEFEGVTSVGTPPFAMKPGYFAENRFRVYTLQDAVGAAASSNEQSFAVKLVPEAVLSGTVLGADGGPLEGIPVRLRVLTVSDGLERWMQRQGTTTNSEGKYRFAELEAGKYAVSTGFHMEGLADSQGAIAYVPVRYPPVASGGQSGSDVNAAIALEAGEHREASLTPDVEKLYPVTGAISGFGEARGVGFQVETAGGEEISPMSRFFPGTGEFRLMLPGGTFAVTATTYTQMGPLESRKTITVPQGPVRGAQFALEPAATIPVEVERQAVATAGNGSQNVGGLIGGIGGGIGQPGDEFPVNVSLRQIEPAGSMASYGAQPRRRRGGDGTSPGGAEPLAIENVVPGRYLLQAMPNSPWYVSSASCGGVDLMREELAIAGGAAGCAIRVVLRNDMGSVHVTVRDASKDAAAGQNSERYVVALLPVGDIVRQMIPLGSQGPGSRGLEFDMDGVAPGRYLVVAMDHRKELAYRDPETMRRLAGLGSEIVVNANGKVDVEVSPMVAEP